MRKNKFFGFLIASLLLHTLSSFMSDILITNYSFERDLAGWTEMSTANAGDGSITVVKEQADDGLYSLKVVDDSKTRGFGIKSTKIPCDSGELYTAFARVYLVSGKADLYLRFWSGSRLLPGRGQSTLTGPSNEWRNISATTKAPPGATHVSVVLYSDNNNQGVAYWDKVLITKQFTNLGMQVYDASPNGTTFGIGANSHKAYCVVGGTNKNPPVMMVIDTNTGNVLQSIPFPTGTTGAWAATTASNGAIYFGTYSNSTIYRHTPTVIPNNDLTPVAGAGGSIIFDLTAGRDEKIYGGTYGNARMFSYSPDTLKVKQVSTNPFMPQTQYVRSLTHDSVNEVTYLSVGVGPEVTGIYRYHHRLDEKVKILPAASLAAAMDYTGERVFVFMSGVARVLKVKAKKNGSYLSSSEEAVFSCKAHVSPSLNGKVYYFTSAGALSTYDIGSKTTCNLIGNIEPGSYVKKLAWVNKMLVGIVVHNNHAYIIRYDPRSPGSLTKIPLTGTVKMPGALNEVQGGPDGKIYTSAYLTGGLGVYNPMLGDENDALEDTMFSPISQIDRMSSFNGKLYIGAYPGAKLYEYTPGQPWSLGINPRSIISGAAAPYFQDRPKAVLGASTANGKYIFMASAAQTGKPNGGIVWYNFETGASGKDSVANQSPISMAVYGNQLFVGTSVRRGYATIPNTESSEVLIYDILNNGIKYSQKLTLPVSKLKSVTKLLVVGTRIWGFADGHVFVLNPDTKIFESCELKFPTISYGTGGTYRDADMFVLPQDPDHVYGTIGGSLVRIGIRTGTPETLVTGADKATYDTYGNIYYGLTSDKAHLCRYVLIQKELQRY